MTSLRQHFQNLRKVSSQIFVKVMWSKFHRNRSNSVQIKGCYRQTDRQTDAQTGIAPGTTYSVMKWLNIKIITWERPYRKRQTMPFLNSSHQELSNEIQQSYKIFIFRFFRIILINGNMKKVKIGSRPPDTVFDF